MTFSQKLFKLRKEKGWSQETLAEKLNTTRQAVSKWENNQGFPETEKLLMIGNLFEVSIDYLLKETQEKDELNEKGYYVSREMAEGYLLNGKRTAQSLARGISLFLLAIVPYMMFKQSPQVYLLLSSMMVAVGIMNIVRVEFNQEEHYKQLKNEVLLFDESYLKELKAKHAQFKNKSGRVITVAVGAIGMAGFVFLLGRKEVVGAEILSPYYPVCIVAVAVGVYILVREFTILEAYDVLARNEAYINSIEFKLLKKMRKKIHDQLS